MRLSNDKKNCFFFFISIFQEAMVLRHHNEAESMNAVQKMDWEWKMKELTLCEYKAQPVIEETHVPMVHVSEDFDLLPA